MVKQSCTSAKLRSCSCTPGALQRELPREPGPFERQEVAPGHRQEVVDVGRAAKADRAPGFAAACVAAQHQRGGAVGDQRAVGLAQRCSDHRVLVGDGVAEVEAQVAPQVRQRVARAVGVVLGRDARQRRAVVAVALEIGLREAREDPGESQALVRLLGHVAGIGQGGGHFAAADAGHLLRADDQDGVGLAGFDGRHRLVQGRGAGGACVFHARRRAPAQARFGLVRVGAHEVLAHHAHAGVPDEHGVHFARIDVRVLQGLRGGLPHQCFEVQGVELAEGQVAPADDVGSGHAVLREGREENP